MDESELHARLMDDARRYDPAVHTRDLLAPYRDVVLLQRTKFMSYEQIAATLTRHGLKVSPAAIGVFCRRTFTKPEIERARRSLPQPTERTAARSPATSAIVAPALGASASRPVSSPLGKRGPKIARDNY